jgi:hypothetical protein
MSNPSMEFRILGAALALALAQAAPNRAMAGPITGFAVHEWGTFTILAGADGTPLRWYQPEADLVGLPAFVGTNPAGAKSAPVPSLVRMETPVLYFYPPKPMHVRARASLVAGSITEWFPAPLPANPADTANATSVVWSGRLFPPDDSKVRQRVPPATSDGREDHYFQARAVPQAWLFQSDVPAKPDAPNADHFIFYRGKGDAGPLYSASAPADDRVQFGHRGGGPGVRTAFALSVNADGAVWKRLPALPAWEANAANSPVEAHFDSARIPVTDAEAQLATAITKELVDAGLTAAEAAAMVATWQGHWFREPGVRILAILPRAWVDQILPLEITPAPEKLERVFVARFEVFTPGTERALLELLGDDGDGEPPGARKARFESLQLGRFAAGALQRVQNIAGDRMAARFRSLTHGTAAPGAPRAQ